MINLSLLLMQSEEIRDVFSAFQPLQFSGFKNIGVTAINVNNKKVKECLLRKKKNNFFFVLNMIWYICP